MSEFSTSTNASPATILRQRLVKKSFYLEIRVGEVSPVTGNGRKFAAADFRREGATIFLPRAYAEYQLYHELLHVERAYIGGIKVCSAQLGLASRHTENISEFNNSIDHAFIIPMEIKTYPEAVNYWRQDFSRLLWESSVHRTPENSFIAILFQGWLVLPHVPQLNDVARLHREALLRHNKLDEARKLTRAVQRFQQNKEAAMDALRQALGGYPDPSFCFYQTYAPQQIS